MFFVKGFSASLYCIIFPSPMKSCCLLPLQGAARLYSGLHGCTAATLPGSPGPLPLYAKSYAKTRKNRQKAQINTNGRQARMRGKEETQRISHFPRKESRNERKKEARREFGVRTRGGDWFRSVCGSANHHPYTIFDSIVLRAFSKSTPVSFM